MSCQVSSPFPVIEQYLQIAQSQLDFYPDTYKNTSYVYSNPMSIKNEDPFLVNESYDKLMMPMLSLNYQNVDTIPDSNPNAVNSPEPPPELLNLDDIKPGFISDFMPVSNPIDQYNSDPRYWSEPDVKRWVQTKLSNYGITLHTVYWDKFNGLELCKCSKEQLLQYLHNPTAADIIYSELKNLKTEFQIVDYADSFDYNSLALQNNILSSTPKAENFFAIKTYLKHTSPPADQYSNQFNSDSSDSLSSVSTSPSSEMDKKIIYDCDYPEPKTVRHKQNIHLWQFLKELLGEADRHNNCIRWLNNKDGIFKIEDSAHVAKLWGQRKNRPAMNYDKLSRSLRQYYKKGIIKKTLASKRLVYQFGSRYL